MRRILFTSLLILLTAIVVVSCSTGKTGDSSKIDRKQELANTMRQKVQDQNFVFNAQQALPMGMKNRILSGSEYTVNVTKDSVDAYLPYFGRAYSAPIGNTEGGIKFISTDFDYTVDKETKNGWNISIKINSEPQHNYQLSFSISSSGSTTLTVNDYTRQSITFYGQISN